MQGPAEAGSLAGAMDELVKRGFTEHFTLSGEALRGANSGRTFRPGELVILDYRRFEGISDPDDMSIVYAIAAEGGIRGTLVDAFGVYADPRVGAFLEEVAIRPPPWHGPR
jgi:hypothetical protein